MCVCVCVCVSHQICKGICDHQKLRAFNWPQASRDNGEEWSPGAKIFPRAPQVRVWVDAEAEMSRYWPGGRGCSCLVTKSCLILCDLMDSNPPGFSVHGSLQARKLEWVAISFSRGFSRPRDGPHISCVVRRILYH